MTKLEHYIAKYKEHEARRASTNERNMYWARYQKESKENNV